MNLFIVRWACESGKVACPKTGRCRSRSWLCDSEDDCRNNWDENTSNCADMKYNVYPTKALPRS